jgi:hypothetical protein
MPSKDQVQENDDISQNSMIYFDEHLENDNQIFRDYQKLSSKRLIFDEKRFSQDDLNNFYEFRYSEFLPEQRNKLEDRPFYVVDTIIPIYKNEEYHNKDYCILKNDDDNVQNQVARTNPANSKKFLIIDTYWVDLEHRHEMIYESRINKGIYSKLELCPY